MNENDLSKLMTLYNCLYKETDEIYGSLARHFGMPETSFWIIYFLREQSEPKTQTELCTRLSISKQTVNSSLKQLRKENLIVLETNALNHRSKRIKLTTEGAALAEKTVDLVFGMEERAFACFTDEERSIFIMLAQKHVGLLRREAGLILSD